MFDEIMAEITEEMWPFRSQIADQEQVRAALAMARQKRIAAANARLDRVFMDGVGEVVATIDADIYHRFGLLYGYDTLNSPEFVESLLHDNPDMRVNSRSRHVRIIVPHWDARDGETQSSADVCTEPAPIIECGSCGAPFDSMPEADICPHCLAVLNPPVAEKGEVFVG